MCRKEEQVIFDVWNSFSEMVSRFKTVVFGVLTIFESTFTSASKTFSNRNLKKNKLRSRLNEVDCDTRLKLNVTNVFQI